MLEKSITEKYDSLASIRNGLSTGASDSREIIRKQLKIEAEIKKIEFFISKSIQFLKELSDVAKRLEANKHERSNLPKEIYSAEDKKRIQLFKKYFRSNASSFDYQSAPISNIDIKDDSLIPYLADLELREIQSKNTKDTMPESSASDFVRLIWSYLLSLFQTSTTEEH